MRPGWGRKVRSVVHGQDLPKVSSGVAGWNSKARDRSAPARRRCAINRDDTAYIFGATWPARAIGAAIITPAANMECMNLHLAEIVTQVAPGSIAALICDGAGWHQRGGEIKLPVNIELLPLNPALPS